MSLVMTLGVVLAVFCFDAAVGRQVAPRLLPNARTPRYQKPVLQSYRLSSHLRETGRWPLRGEGQWRVGIRSSRQNLEAVGAGPWISRMRPF
jgi:hypothetical protein